MDVKYFEMKTDDGQTVTIWASMKTQIRGTDGSVLAELDSESAGALFVWAAMFFNGAVNSGMKEQNEEFAKKGFFL